jgi:hypothetical protein
MLSKAKRTSKTSPTQGGELTLGIVYQSSQYDPEKHCGSSDSFLPVFDYSDHLQFACTTCKEVAVILQVKKETCANTPILYFLMLCPKCGGCGMRKVYLEYAGSGRFAFPSKVNWLDRASKEAKPEAHERTPKS